MLIMYWVERFHFENTHTHTNNQITVFVKRCISIDLSLEVRIRGKSNSDHIVIQALALWPKFMNSNINFLNGMGLFSLSFESLESMFSLDCSGAWKRQIYCLLFVCLFVYWKPVDKSIYSLHLHGVHTLSKPQNSFCLGWRNSGTLALPAELPAFK